MDQPEISIGLRGSTSERVDADMLASALGSGDVDVYGTPAMIALMEKAALDALSDVLTSEYTSVGIALDVRHIAATPLGMTVTASAIVTSVEGRVITFEVHAEDEAEQIGAGRHQRAIVKKESFQARADAKRVMR